MFALMRKKEALGWSHPGMRRFRNSKCLRRRKIACLTHLQKTFRYWFQRIFWNFQNANCCLQVWYLWIEMVLLVFAAYKPFDHYTAPLPLSTPPCLPFTNSLVHGFWHFNFGSLPAAQVHLLCSNVLHANIHPSTCKAEVLAAENASLSGTGGQILCDLQVCDDWRSSHEPVTWT